MAYDRLANVEEFIRDTEEFVNFELDSSRNRLIRLEIVLTAATFGLAIFGTVAGLPLHEQCLAWPICAVAAHQPLLLLVPIPEPSYLLALGCGHIPNANPV